MLQTLIYLVIVLLVLGMLTWLVDYLPVPQPLNKMAKIVIVIIGFIVIIGVLLGIAGGPGLSLR